MVKRLLAAVLGPIVLTLLAPAAASAAVPPVKSCADVKAANPAATDGNYSIFPIGLRSAQVRVFCADMAGTPKEYLNLLHSSGANFASYFAGGASPGTTVVTHYSKIRFNPAPVTLNPLTYVVNIADETYTVTTGQLCHSSSATPCPSDSFVTYVPYGVAFDCVGDGMAHGMANVDLRGTDFKIVDTYTPQGFAPTGATTPSHGGRELDVTGGGFCGWNAPATTFDPFNLNPLMDARGGWDLTLVQGDD
jgi:hypothetical protein